MPTQIGANRAGNYIGTPEADTIYGAGGNDTLNGEGGNDILTSAGGNGQFVFDTALPEAAVDTIIGFFIDDNFDNDKIVLDKTVFSALETVAGNPLTAGDFSVINVAATSEVVVAGNSVNEIVYNSAYYPSHQKRIHLFGSCHESYLGLITNHCSVFGITVTWES